MSAGSPAPAPPAGTRDGKRGPLQGSPPAPPLQGLQSTGVGSSHCAVFPGARAIAAHLWPFAKSHPGKGDDVFLPKDIDLDSVDMDETEREVEYFKSVPGDRGP
ncbi:hypothetical protein Celaphus_00017276 [Cervus elaphus hippelaphus]|uniref:FAM193 C-terminal domain-containing protein n=1 Tax=Cervus elaphus hippelaphus TaxID=46360 RepID=A0A212D5T9_CEREH|nr:hypothetical protein Celaphus_00017276 [Cervus elaphus hippelaphus]